MSVPFPAYSSHDSAQPFAPLGVPVAASSTPGRGYLPVPSPAPYTGGRARTYSHPTSAQQPQHVQHHHHRHHHSSTDNERDRDHHHHSRSHSHGRSHGRSHSRSHSHSRSRHHSHSAQAPPVLVNHYSEPYVYQLAQPPTPAPPVPVNQSYSYSYGASAYAPPMSSYGVPVSVPRPPPSQAAYPSTMPMFMQPQTQAQAPIPPPYAAHPPRPPPVAASVGMPVPATGPSAPRDVLHKERRRKHSRSQAQGQAQGPAASQMPWNNESLLSQEVTGHKKKHGFMHPLFHYSRCTGKKKAVCIGINYSGTDVELNGCVNDAKNMYHFLHERHGYEKKNMLYLVDTSPDPRARPTKALMIRAIKWLVKDAQEDDSLFFHYSGHGGQQRDPHGDEADGMDEVIFPSDYKRAGVITDDELHELLVRPLPPGCRLTALFDSCHSGSILDLPYLYDPYGRSKKSDVAIEWRERRWSPADVITWSGSTDAQTSADTVQNGLAVGAMSHAFVKVLKRNPNISYQDLLGGVRDVLKAKYSQTPQLSSSHHIDTGLRFIL